MEILPYQVLLFMIMKQLAQVVDLRSMLQVLEVPTVLLSVHFFKIQLQIQTKIMELYEQTMAILRLPIVCFTIIKPIITLEDIQIGVQVQVEHKHSIPL